MRRGGLIGVACALYALNPSHISRPFVLPEQRMPEANQSSETIAIADRLELRMLDLDTGETRRYPSSVLDISARQIGVAIPTDRRVPVVIPEGTTLVVSLWKDFADNLFKAKVLGKIGGKVPQLILSRPSPDEIKRTPRREFFRVDTKIPTRAHLVEQGEATSLSAIMLDLSAGGCRLQTARRLPADLSLLLDFDLPFPPDKDGFDRSKPLRQVPGKVKLSFTPTERDSKSRARQTVHMVGVEFSSIDNVVRNSILRYVAFRQREIINQLQESSRAEGGEKSAEEVKELQERLDELEEDLREAGQEVPELQNSPPPPDPAPPPPADSIDALFSQPPPAPAETSTAAPSSPRPLPPGVEPSGKTILLVEDEEDLRPVLAEALQYRGHRILEAANGQQALAIAAKHSIDLVITDLMMPKMNGWRLLSALRERGMEMPVVIITAYMNQEGQEVLTNRDISSFLVKPIDLEEMNAVVDDLLAPPRSRRPRIMAVDDEEETRLLVSACLGKAGFEVETISGGREALARIGHFRPDLLLLDIVMPEMNGFEVAQRLRRNPATANLPIVMLTAKSSAEYVRKAVALKIGGYMVKPFSPKSLVERIRKQLKLKPSV